MAVIRGFGKYLPPTVRTNADLAALLGVTPEWIEEVSGIRERRVAVEDSVVTMGIAAAKDLPGLADVRMLLVSSGSPERIFPGPAGQIALGLGLGGIPAIDLPLASAGGLFSMALASKLVESTGHVLVIATEKMSTAGMQEPPDKNLAILFGDGAGACLIAPEGPGLRILSTALHSDGTAHAELARDFAGRMFMNGMNVIRHASQKLPAVIREVLGETSPEEITAFVTHQANKNLIDRVARAVGVEAERFYSNIAQYGNTSSASMLIAAAELFETNSDIAGKICFAGFGAGYNWGAILVETPPRLSTSNV